VAEVPSEPWYEEYELVFAKDAGHRTREYMPPEDAKLLYEMWEDQIEEGRVPPEHIDRITEKIEELKEIERESAAFWEAITGLKYDFEWGMWYDPVTEEWTTIRYEDFL